MRFSKSFGNDIKLKQYDMSKPIKPMKLSNSLGNDFKLNQFHNIKVLKVLRLSNFPCNNNTSKVVR